MKEEDILQKLLKGLENLVGLTEKELEIGPMKGDPLPEAEVLLADLEMKVGLLQKAKERAEREMEALNTQNAEVPKDQAKLIARTNKLHTKTKAIKEILGEAATNIKSNKKKPLGKKGTEDKKGKKRREKFKPLGGTKGWMPL